MGDRPSVDITVDSNGADSNGAWTVVRVAGDLDMATAPQLEETCESLEDLALALDLSAVRFIDSSGLRALVRVREMAEDMAIVDPSAVVRRLLELTRMTETFTVSKTLEALGEAG